MLFCGSYSYLKEKLLKQIEKLDKTEKLTFIVHTNQMKVYLKEYLAKNLGILVNAKFYTLIDISKEITNIEPLDDFNKELIFKKFLFEKGLRLDQLAEEFNLLTQQIKEFEISLSNITSPFVREIIQKYENFKSNEYFDREDIHILAIKRLKKLQKRNLFGNLFIFGIKSVPVLHQRLFLALKDFSKDIFVFFPIFSDSGYYKSYSHFGQVKNFYKGLAKKIKEEKQEDINSITAKKIYNFDNETKKLKNNNINLFKFKNEYEELEYIAQQIIKLKEKGIDFYKIGIVVPDIEGYLPFIKEVFRKYKIPYYLLEENRYIDKPIFRKLFSIFEVKQKNFSKDAVLNILSKELINIKNLETLKEALIKSPIIEGFKDYEEFLFKENTFEDFKIFLEKLNNLLPEDNINNYVKTFLEINADFILNEKTKIFLENILRTIQTADIYQRLFPKIKYEDFVSIIKTFFSLEDKENKIRGNTVSIVTPISAEANNFEYLFFVNLNSGVFPSTLREEVLASFNQFNYPYHILMQEILNFCNILDKNKKINYSYITNSITYGQRAPSVLFEELRRILDKKIEMPKISYEMTLKDLKIKYAKSLVNIDKHLKRKWKTLNEKDKLSRENFKYENVNIHFPISATKFTTYAYCPYKFFLENVVGLEETMKMDRTKIPPTEIGNLVHKILQTFYEKIIFEKVDLEKNIQEIRKIYFQEIEKLMKVVLPSYRPFEYQKVITLFSRLENFLKEDIKRIQNHKRKVEILEGKFENNTFKGKVDRAEKDAEGNYYIYDYKTSEISLNEKNIEEEIKTKYIQLVIYKLLLEEKNLPVKEIGIFAVNNKYGRYLYTINREDKLNELENHLKNLVSSMKEGRFFPNENEFCSYCQFLNICEKDKIDKNDEKN